MKIALCDDDQFYLSKYEQALNSCAKVIPNLESDSFSSGEALIEEYKDGKTPYDIIFLDVQMQGMDGLKTAQIIREHDEDVLIIYVSNYDSYVYYVFQLEAFDFIRKSTVDTEFKTKLYAACEKVVKKRDAFYITVDRMPTRVVCSQLRYIESDHRTLLFHLRDKVYRTYGKLSKYETFLREHDFIFIHKSYLVNMNYVDRISSTDALLENGLTLPVSEKKRTSAKTAFMHFMVKK